MSVYFTPKIELIPTKFGTGDCYKGWKFNSGNYLFTTDTK